MENKTLVYLPIAAELKTVAVVIMPVGDFANLRPPLRPLLRLPDCGMLAGK